MAWLANTSTSSTNKAQRLSYHQQQNPVQAVLHQDTRQQAGVHSPVQCGHRLAPMLNLRRCLLQQDVRAGCAISQVDLFAMPPKKVFFQCGGALLTWRWSSTVCPSARLSMMKSRLSAEGTLSTCAPWGATGIGPLPPAQSQWTTDGLP